MPAVPLPTDRLPVNALCLAPEQALPADLWTPDGRLLLAKGRQLGSHEHIRLLDSHHPSVRVEDAPTWRAATGDPTPVHAAASIQASAAPAVPIAPHRPAAPPAGLHGRWLDLHGALHVLLRRGDGAVDFLPRITAIGEQVRELTHQQPDKSLFVLVQLLYDSQSPYCASNALASAAIAQLLAAMTALPPDACTSLRHAALTMNLAMSRVQDELARQKSPPGEHQRATIHAHPAEGHAALQGLGVQDEQWLDLVLNHHETPDGSGYPGGRAADGLALRILRLADRFVARISPRGSRGSLSARQAVRAHYLELRDHPSQLGELLVRRLGLYVPGSYVRLRNGEVAVVVRTTEAMDQPIVQALLHPNGMPYGAPKVRHTLAPEFQVVEPVLAEKVRIRLDPSRVL